MKLLINLFGRPKFNPVQINDSDYKEIQKRKERYGDIVVGSKPRTIREAKRNG